MQILNLNELRNKAELKFENSDYLYLSEILKKLKLKTLKYLKLKMNAIFVKV